MRVAVTGSHGLIGSALVADLRLRGHEVVPLVRGTPVPSRGEVAWDPAAGTIDTEALGTVDAAVNLAGVGIGDHRWTPAHKAAVLESRINGTGLLARTLASLERPPAVLAQASAVGYYGDRGDEELTEESGPGSGFLSDVVQQWEAAATPAAEAGIPVVAFRSGIVLSPDGGALKKQLTPFKLGVGGKLGTGHQWVSWITIGDEVAAIGHLIETPSLDGPVNLTAPNPVTNAEFTRTLGRVLRRPTFAPVPNVALNMLFGKEMVADMILGSQRVLPKRLASSDFTFGHAELESALRHLLERPTA